MGTSASNNEICQEPYSGKTKVIIISIVLAIIGSLISGSFAKETVTNYAGFIMLLTGITTFVIGVFATAAAYLKPRLCQEAPATLHLKRTRILFLSIWSIGIGIVLAVLGYILGGAYAGYLILDSVSISSISYGLRLTGTGAFLIGVTATTIIGLKQRKKQPDIKGAKPKGRLSSGLLIGIAVILVITGFTLAGSYAKESIMNMQALGRYWLE